MRKTIRDLWIDLNGNIASLGLTRSFLEESGDITFVNFQVREGDPIKEGDVLASLETVKSVVEVRSPISGKVLKVNEKVSEDPDLINEDPEKVYLAKIEVAEDEVKKIEGG